MATISGYEHLADQRAVRVIDVHAVAGAGPDPAGLVEPEAVEAADGALRELAAVRERAVVGDVEHPHVLDARVAHVEQALVEAEGEPVRAVEVVAAIESVPATASMRNT